MKKFYFLISALTLFSISVFAQRPEGKKVKITGTIIEKVSKQPLEYATITFINSRNPKAITGGITNSKGEFDVDVNAGTYTIKAEFISFKATELKSQKLSEDANLGVISLEEDPTQLNEVVVRAEVSTVEIKLDKKVYNVGQDLMVKGGTVSDVLDNIPSVSVDVEGNVSLRGNDNVRILIDGKPTNAINVADALRLIPADAIDKVEVITNPSARYDAEGGGGILNIILKVGKNQGINGTFILSGGSPENTGILGSINVKSELSNVFATVGYNKRNNPGNTKINQTNYDDNHNFLSYIEERRNNKRESEGINGNFGIELYLTKSSSWTNTLSLRNNNGGNPENVIYNQYSADGTFRQTQRFNDLSRATQDVSYSTNFTKKFKRDGHKFTVDASFGEDTDIESSNILGSGIVPVTGIISSDRTINNQQEGRNLVQSDYVLPLGKSSQFEAGFKGTYNQIVADYKVEGQDLGTGIYSVNPFFTNKLQYKENVTAFYSQFGSKISKFSYLLGLRFEESHITINQLTTQDFNFKKYNNLFPSAFLTYELKEGTSLSLSYSKRITRPRDRFINPFSSYSSNTNLFQGNPNLDPALSDAYDLGFLNKWTKVTLSASLYINKTTGAFQIVTKERGDQIAGVPVIINTPFNLANDDKFGFEFTLNYSPFKWWKVNGNFNFFSDRTAGSYTYTNTNNEIATIDFNNSASSWFTRLTSKVNLPYKVDFQANGTYNAAQNTAQGKTKANASANLAFSKDILKDKGTLSFNINDVFNSRKRIQEVHLARVDSDSEMQWRQRQFTLAFTYRFNKQKSEKEKLPKKESEDNGDYP